MPSTQVQHITAPVASLNDLLRENSTFAVPANGSTYAYFKNALDPVAKVISKNMIAVAGPPENGVALVTSGQVCCGCPSP
jgi:hypothetical protein